MIKNNTRNSNLTNVLIIKMVSHKLMDSHKFILTHNRIKYCHNGSKI